MAGINNLLRVSSATIVQQPVMISGSPDMTMSPAWVNNKLEHFKGIDKMIGHWEEMERKEEKEDGSGSNGSKEGRRSSHRMRQLVGLFEEGGGGMNGSDSQLEGMGQ